MKRRRHIIYERTFKLLYLAVIFILSGCSSINNNIRYDYYGSAVDITDLKDNVFITTDEYVYAFISDGQVWNSLESPELFGGLMDLNIADKDSYSKLSINDSISSGNNTLVLSQAETMYEYYPTTQNEPGIIGSRAWFDGELSVKGYITLDHNDTIFFLPGNGEWNGLPMLFYATKAAWSQEDYGIIANAPFITLGNLDDYNNGKITVNADKTLREVYITINNLELCWRDGDYGSVVNSANIVNISYL